jgi:hypothetical protein
MAYSQEQVNAFVSDMQGKGIAPEKAIAFLRDKGLLEEQATGVSAGDYATKGLVGYTAGLGAPLIAGIGATLEKAKGAKESFSELYGKYGQAIEDRQDYFSQNKPKTAFATELAGMVASTPAHLAGKGIAKVAGGVAGKVLPNFAKGAFIRGAGRGIAETLPYTAGYGISGILSNKPKEEIVGGSAVDLTAGALLGGIGGKFLKGFSNKEYNAVKEAFGQEGINKALKSGNPLLDAAGEKGVLLAEYAKKDPDAAQVIKEYGWKRLSKQKPEINALIDERFGSKGSLQLLDELQAASAKEAAPAWNKALYQLDKDGNILLDNFGKEVGRTVDITKFTPAEIDYITKVYNNKATKYAVKGLPQNDMRVLNYAKQIMDDDVQQAYAKAHKNQARNLEEIRDAFVKKVDEANPDFAPARKITERRYRAEEALSAGKKFDGKSRKNFLYDYEQMTPEQKKFYRLGVGERLVEKTNSPTEGGNIYKKVFDAETLKRLKTIDFPGIEQIAERAKAEQLSAANLERLIGGSQTAERLNAMKVGESNFNAFSPLKGIKRALSGGLLDIAGDVFNPNQAKIAEIITNPRALQQAQIRANNPNAIMRIAEVINQPAGRGAILTPVAIRQILEQQEGR